MTFSSFGLSADLLRAITERHYPAPTPIQHGSDPGNPRGQRCVGLRTHRVRQDGCLRAAPAAAEADPRSRHAASRAKV